MQLSDEAVYEYLKRSGIKYSNKGFFYCSLLIKLASENVQPSINMEEIYEKIGTLYGVNAQSVSRAIRYSLKPIGLKNKEFLAKAIYDVFYTDIFDLKNTATT